MKVNSVVNPQIIQRQQNFKVNSAVFGPFLNPPSYQPTPFEIYKAYTSHQLIQSYKMIKTFDIPNVGQGKLYELANGHKVVIVKKNGLTVINTFVGVGNEDSTITSHLLEHLIYSGENNINPTKFSEIVALAGAESNAATHGNYTEYFISYPFNEKENIDKLIKTQAELMQNPSFTREQLEKEKKIILTEYKGKEIEQKLKNKDALFTDALLDVNRKNKKPDYSKEAIDKISFEEVMNFYNKNYINNNMVSVVVGDLNADEVIKLFSKYFNKKSTININRQIEPKRVLQSSKRMDLADNLYFDNPINIGFVGPKNKNSKDSFLAMALTIYINELSKQPDNTGIKLSTVVNGNKPEDDLGLKFSILSPDDNKEKINILNQYLKDLTQKSISDEDIQNLKTRLKNSYSLAVENSEKVSSIIGSTLINNNNENYLDMHKYIDTLTPEELQNFIKIYINPQKQLTLVYHKNQPLNDNTKVSFTGSNINGINTENIREYNFPNNLQLIIDVAPEITRTTFSLELKHYKLPSNKIKTYIILEKILNNMESPNNNNLYGNNLNEIKLQSDLDIFKVVVNNLPENTMQVIDIAKKVILKPNFDKNNFEKIKNQLRNNKENFDDIQFGDVVNLYNDIISHSEGKAVLTVPQNTFIKEQYNIISNINKDMPLFPKKQRNISTLKNSFRTLDKTKIIIEKDYGYNTTIYQGFKITNSNEIGLKNTMTLSLLSEILGEGRNSRLFKDIRENQNLVYNLTSRYEEKGKNSYFEILAEVPMNDSNSADLQNILNSYKNNINQLITTPILKEELNQAKMLLKGKYMQKFETSSFSRNELISQFSLDEIKILFKTIDEISPNDIQNTAKEYLAKPSIISIKANQEIIDLNKDYLEKLYEIN